MSKKVYIWAPRWKLPEIEYRELENVAGPEYQRVLKSVSIMYVYFVMSA